MNDFDKCTTKIIHPSGRTVVICKLGLWSVTAPTELEAISEGIHYFEQYKSDGEYHEIIGGVDLMVAIRRMLRSGREEA